MMFINLLSSWQAIARVHLVHMMNADRTSDGCQPSD